MLGKLNHTLKNLAVLRQKEILRAEFLDRCIEGVVIEEDGTEDAALRFQIVGEGPFDRGVCRSHSLYFRLGLFGMQEAEFMVCAEGSRSMQIVSCCEARGILRVVRRRVNRMGGISSCEYLGKVENVN